MNQDRFEKALEILKQVDPKKFDMEVWGKMPEERANRESPQVLGDCKSAGCAIGWIASDPWSQQEGLKLWWEGHRMYSEAILVPEYKGVTGFSAAAAFFGLSEKEAGWLFSYDEYPREQEDVDDGHVEYAKTSLSDVIARMEGFLAHGMPRYEA